MRRFNSATSFFTWTRAERNQPWDGIDAEVLGKGTRLPQANYFTDGTGAHKIVVDLRFDAAAGFTSYAIDGEPPAGRPPSEARPAARRRAGRRTSC